MLLFVDYIVVSMFILFILTFIYYGFKGIIRVFMWLTVLLVNILLQLLLLFLRLLLLLLLILLTTIPKGTN
jgi:hypothetical protein